MPQTPQTTSSGPSQESFSIAILHLFGAVPVSGQATTSNHTMTHGTRNDQAPGEEEKKKGPLLICALLWLWLASNLKFPGVSSNGTSLKICENCQQSTVAGRAWQRWEPSTMGTSIMNQCPPALVVKQDRKGPQQWLMEPSTTIIVGKNQ